MVDFDPLYVTGGVGPVHINRFRTRIRPNPGQAMPNGYGLVNLMPRFMDGRTAQVAVDNHRRYRQEASLLFRGVARVRPFFMLRSVLPLPFPPGTPDWIKDLGVPEAVRDWIIPDIHTDSVGLEYLGQHAFTVQTLKRRFATGDDHTIRNLIVHVVIPMFFAAIPLASIAEMAARPLLRRYLHDPLADLAIDVNRHHFLAGRRSFALWADGRDWVFETAALERYSRLEFQLATDIAMGGAKDTVSPVWIQMGAKVAAHFGRQIGPTEEVHSQQSPQDWDRDALWRDVATRHAALMP